MADPMPAAPTREQRSAHTPGPWYVGEDRAEDCPDHANSGLALVDTGREHDWPIARLCEWNNVYLLAAAPDLLDGCNALLGLIQLVCARDDTPAEIRNVLQTNHRIGEARAAIAKSEGRS